MVAAEPDSQITFLDFNQKSESLFKVWSRKLRLVFILFFLVFTTMNFGNHRRRINLWS